MLKAPVAVFVSGGGTNLQALLDASLAHAQIALVISSNPSAFALTRAEKAGVEHIYIAKENFEREALALLKARNIRVIALAGFLRILSEDFLNAFGGYVVNVHPSLIPAFCGKGYYGLRVHEEALKRGVKVTGATVHLVNAIPDGGEILLQKAVEVVPGDTPETLQKRVMTEAEWILLPRAVDQIAQRITEGV